jgi:iron complex outermembrane receptor protein
MKKSLFSFISFVAIFSLAADALSAASVSGRVSDIFGHPLAGIQVLVREEGSRVLTSRDGLFTVRFADSRERVELVFSGTLHHPESRRVEKADFASPLDIFLTPLPMAREEMTITAPRQRVPLAETPAAVSIVTRESLGSMPRAVAADEALRSVPGVKVDNQANGERVHLSMRGIGILTERGIRGIQVLVDGIPLNDPSGFAPDLFDIDWSTVDHVEVVRGPLGFLYGGGSSGGVIQVVTRAGADVPAAGNAWAAAGSNAFWKGMVEAGGTAGRDDALNYRVSFSRGSGEGYREHTAFWSNNLYGKFRWRYAENFQLTGIVSGTGFFNENAEGLNLAWLAQDRRMANPDAIIYNEFQKTRRVTAGLNGEWNISGRSGLSFTVFGRSTLWLESVPSSLQHRRLFQPGLLVQYRLASGRNHFSAGVDWGRQSIAEYRRPNLGEAREGDSLASDQKMLQNGLGVYVMDRLEIDPRFSFTLGVRHDRVGNELTDHLKANGLDLSGTADFQRTTARLGVNWNPGKQWGLYAGWGLGFLPPATEELYANPDALGGFNRSLKPATSSGGEIGLRATLGRRFLCDLALFHLATRDDFERYRIPGRPLETFYGNAGNSRRNGMEASLSWLAGDSLTLAAAYTYSDFTYSEYTSLTFPGDLAGHFLPNSPRHQFSVDVGYRFGPCWFAGFSAEGYSRAFIDPTNAAWIDGYVLCHARAGYRWSGRSFQGEVMLTVKNLADKKYIAFTEPDPDGNSYQPGAPRELFATLQVRF